jgi:hypothetical protein
MNRHRWMGPLIVGLGFVVLAAGVLAGLGVSL